LELDRQRLQSYEKLIKDILSAFGRIPFHIVVESLLGHKVEPVDVSKQEDGLLIQDIEKLADTIAQKYHTERITREVYYQIRGKRPEAFRNNEVGVIVESSIASTYARARANLAFIRNLTHLPAMGYPDLEILDTAGRTSYVDVKTTSRPQQGSPRDFYLTPLENTKDKVRADARHLVLSFITQNIAPEQFITVGWKLIDLSRINLRMKPEFNCDNLEMYKAEAIVRERTL